MCACRAEGKNSQGSFLFPYLHLCLSLVPLPLHQAGRETCRKRGKTSRPWSGRLRNIKDLCRSVLGIPLSPQTPPVLSHISLSPAQLSVALCASLLSSSSKPQGLIIPRPFQSSNPGVDTPLPHICMLYPCPALEASVHGAHCPGVPAASGRHRDGLDVMQERVSSHLGYQTSPATCYEDEKDFEGPNQPQAGPPVVQQMLA